MLADLVYVISCTAAFVFFALYARGIVMYIISGVLFMFSLSHMLASMVLIGLALISGYSLIIFTVRMMSKRIRNSFGPVIGQPLS